LGEGGEGFFCGVERTKLWREEGGGRREGGLLCVAAEARPHDVMASDFTTTRAASELEHQSSASSTRSKLRGKESCRLNLWQLVDLGRNQLLSPTRYRYL
jgi:hypothetical protein